MVVAVAVGSAMTVAVAVATAGGATTNFNGAVAVMTAPSARSVCTLII